jgi:hypothetical protein
MMSSHYRTNGQALVQAQTTALPGDKIAVPETKERVELHRRVTMSELRRIRRQVRRLSLFTPRSSHDSHYLSLPLTLCVSLCHVDTVLTDVFVVYCWGWGASCGGVWGVQFTTYTKTHTVGDAATVGALFVQFLNQALQA